MDGPFQDPTNTAVLASRRIIDGDEWVHYVTHDTDAWQFHPHSGPTPDADACVVSLFTLEASPYWSGCKGLSKLMIEKVED